MEQGYKETEGKLDYELDWEFITEMAIRMAQYKDKYGKYNWKQPIDTESIKQALFRHTLAVLKGDTSEDHLAAIACNSMIIKHHERQKK